MDVRLMRLAGAEFLGTFLLVFAGTGAIVAEAVTGLRVTPLGIGLSFGLAIMAAVCLFASVSGAHINPAVTLALALQGRLAWSLAPLYLAAQLLGAIAASGVLYAIFGNVANLGATLPSVGDLKTLALEFGLSFFLVLIVLAVVARRVQPLAAGVAIGGYVGLAATFAGPTTGASMNPARSLGPALVSGAWDGHWLYWAAPIAAAATAGLVFNLLRRLKAGPFARAGLLSGLQV